MWLPYGNKKHLVNLRERLKLLVETAVSQLHSICTIPLRIVGQCVCLCLRVCVCSYHFGGHPSRQIVDGLSEDAQGGENEHNPEDNTRSADRHADRQTERAVC